MKRIFVISDLHIGLPDRANDWNVDDNLFCDHLLNLAKDDSNIIILNGDVFELWQGRSWKRNEILFWDIISKRPRIFLTIKSLIESGKLFYVAGNHDAVIMENKLLLQASMRASFMFGNKILIIEHGHRNDNFNKSQSSSGKVFSWIGGWIERLIYKDIDQDLLELKNKIPGRLMDERDLENYADMIHNQTSASIIVFGHSHRARIKYCPGYVYVNSGYSCNRINKFDQIQIILDNEKFNITHRLVKLI